MISSEWIRTCSSLQNWNSVKSHMLVSQSLHSYFHVLISQCVDKGVQEWSKNCVKHREDLVHREPTKRPHINENAGPKEEGDYHDMCRAGWECFGYPAGSLLLDSDEDNSVGDQEEQKTAHWQQPTVWDHKYTQDIGVHTGQLDHKRKVTEEAVHLIGATVR